MPKFEVNLENRTYTTIYVEADSEDDVEEVVDSFISVNLITEESEDGWEIADFSEIED